MFVCFIKFGKIGNRGSLQKYSLLIQTNPFSFSVSGPKFCTSFIWMNFLNGCSNHSYLTFSFLTISNQQSEKIIIIKIKKINAKLTATEFQFGQFLAMNRIKPHSEPFHGCILLCTAFIWCLNFTDTTIFIFLPIPRIWIICFAKIHNIPFSEKI